MVAEAVNAARDLQNGPANDITPTRLAERAAELAAEHGTLTVETMGRAGIEAAGMGAFAAVAQGSDEEPQLITLRYTPAEAAGPVLGLVGKAVTFDSGGISIKRGRKMSEMKFDMSGGAAVLEAIGAIARLGLPVPVVAVIGATENLPSGRAFKPGDIVRAKNGTTIEIINTDAEGRLVLADCLSTRVEQGAERLVDVATLTGAIVTALGSTYAGLFGADDAWCEAVTAAGPRAPASWCGGCRCTRSTRRRSRAATPTSSTWSRRARPPRSSRPSSCAASPATCRGRTSTSAAPPGTPGARTPARAASGFGVRLLVELATMAPWTSTSPTTTS